MIPALKWTIPAKEWTVPGGPPTIPGGPRTNSGRPEIIPGASAKSGGRPRRDARVARFLSEAAAQDGVSATRCSTHPVRAGLWSKAAGATVTVQSDLPQQQER